MLAQCDSGVRKWEDPPAGAASQSPDLPPTAAGANIAAPPIDRLAEGLFQRFLDNLMRALGGPTV